MRSTNVFKILIIFFMHLSTIACERSHCFFIEPRIGIAPTIWTHRDQFTAVSCTASTIVGLPSSLINLFQMPKFNNLFKVPFIIGIKGGFDLDCANDFYVETNYRRAGKKQFNVVNNGTSLDVPQLDIITFRLDMQDAFQAIDAYAGIRHHFATERCFDFLLGMKIGFVHHRPVNFTFITDSLTVPLPNGPFVSAQLPFFNSSTKVAGGVNGSVYFDMGCNIDVILTAEVVATCGPHGAVIPFDACITAIDINPMIAPNNFIIGSVGTELFFPITIGFMYTF